MNNPLTPEAQIVWDAYNDALEAQGMKPIPSIKNEMEKPKIIQIVILPESDYDVPALYALGSDGSIWTRAYSEREMWQRVPSPFDKEEAQ